MSVIVPISLVACGLQFIFSRTEQKGLWFILPVVSFVISIFYFVSSILHPVRQGLIHPMFISFMLFALINFCTILLAVTHFITRRIVKKST